MTKKQFKEINAKLKKWRDDRHLDLESQRDGLVLNLLEELVEFGRAKNDVEKVDALCDMYIFLLNAYEIDSIENKRFKIGLEHFLYNINCIAYSMETDLKSINIILNADIKSFALRLNIALKEIGYEPYLCLCETIKEIESRSGKYDINTKKWIKDTSKEAKIEWYKANYSKCKLDSIERKDR